ncbi:glycosyltransferase family 2 protein [Leucobacter viscericola]|uniref:Glycosyltransferase family 2 protein n=1 Tax=Leucobacter viscericola TaxID=2714935 RepID=A0A6G7XEN7_9MICO|nr:glycosyltransferase family 2 protein [Leucobacter viscericola]QIK63025.1 glycosyltransferase family 2 protein [Leucobacter viscericola]
MSVSRLVVVMPAYNEAEGLPGFIEEIRSHLKPHAEELVFVIADDQSTDNTVVTLQNLDTDDVRVVPQAVNRGHGPTALAAYRAGLELAPDVVIHVDGDGQFIGEDFPKLLAALQPGVDVVRGVRQNRTDPWFRKVLTACVRAVISTAAGKWQPDVNTPLRAYRPEALQVLIEAIPEHPAVPHVHFSLAEARGKFVTVDIPVESIPRRGSEETGTMWGQVSAPKLPPKRLRQFTRLAAAELWQVSLRPGAPTRKVKRQAAAAA